MKRVLLIDPHPLTRKGLTVLFSTEEEFNVCCQVANAADALTCIERRNPDLAILDVDLPDSNGITLIEQMRHRRPALPIVVFTDRKADALEAIKAGARSFVDKQGEEQDIVCAVRQVLQGKMYVSPEICNSLLQELAADSRPSPVDVLSKREQQVFERLGQGMESKDIAKELGLSPKTIDSYRYRIREKLQIEGSVELIQHAVQWVNHGR